MIQRWSGQLSLGEVQLALGRQVHDELLLRKLAKAVALHITRKEKEQEQQGDMASSPPGRRRISTCNTFANGNVLGNSRTGKGRGSRSKSSIGDVSSWDEHSGSRSEVSLTAMTSETEGGVSEGRLRFSGYSPRPETTSFSGSVASGGAGTSAHDNFMASMVSTRKNTRLQAIPPCTVGGILS